MSAMSPGASPGPAGPQNEPPEDRRVRRLHVAVVLLSAALVGLVAGIFAYAAGDQGFYAATGVGASAAVATITVAFVVMGYVHKA
ncbi:hypothetical protein RB200_11945 [Streptomyces sp. PmtG]